jgi:hypothetical protein
MTGSEGIQLDVYGVNQVPKNSSIANTKRSKFAWQGHFTVIYGVQPRLPRFVLPVMELLFETGRFADSGVRRDTADTSSRG